MNARANYPLAIQADHAASDNSPSQDTGIHSTQSALQHPALLQVSKLIQRHDYHRAADLLRLAGCDPPVRNTLGVCLLRLGHIDEALTVFRQLVLVPGGVTVREGVSNQCMRNFATALLMKGSPSGALDVLSETSESNHVMAERIRESIKAWQNSLFWLRRLDWKLNRIEPRHCQVPIDFEPGELEFEFDANVLERSCTKPAEFALEVSV